MRPRESATVSAREGGGRPAHRAADGRQPGALEVGDPAVLRIDEILGGVSRPTRRPPPVRIHRGREEALDALEALFVPLGRMERTLGETAERPQGLAPEECQALRHEVEAIRTAVSAQLQRLRSPRELLDWTEYVEPARAAQRADEPDVVETLLATIHEGLQNPRNLQARRRAQEALSELFPQERGPLPGGGPPRHWLSELDKVRLRETRDQLSRILRERKTSGRPLPDHWGITAPDDDPRDLLNGNGPAEVAEALLGKRSGLSGKRFRNLLTPLPSAS